MPVGLPYNNWNPRPVKNGQPPPCNLPECNGTLVSRKVGAAMKRLPQIYLGDKVKEQILQKWDPTTQSLVNIRRFDIKVLDIKNIVCVVNNNNISATWICTVSSIFGTITFYRDETPIATINIENKEGLNSYILPSTIISGANYYFTLNIQNITVRSNDSSYFSQVTNDPSTTVTSTDITSTFTFDAIPIRSELYFYDNNLTNSNTGGTLLNTQPISNVINNNITYTTSTVPGNYYYSAILSDNGILYKSVQTRLFPILNSVTLTSANAATDVFIITSVSVSFFCNLKFTFYSKKDSITTLLFSRILFSSVSNQPVSGSDISSTLDYFVRIEAVDSSGDVIQESEFKEYNLIGKPPSVLPIVNTLSINISTLNRYTISWNLSIPSRVRVSLYRNTINSNTGGTLVGTPSIFNVESPRIQTISSILTRNTYYYIIVQPVNITNTNIGTPRTSSVVLSPPS